MLELIFALVLAIGVSAFCSISEASFYSVTAGTVQKLLDEGKNSGKYLSHIKENIDDHIASVLILNTFANTLGVSMATTVALREFGQSIHVIFPILMTILILLFAEIVPKTIGLNYSKKMAPIVAGPFVVINKIFTYTGLVWTTKALTRFFKKESENTEEASPDEIHNLTSLSAQEGQIDKQQEMIIKNILHLKEQYVREIMTPRRVIFSIDSTIKIRESIEKKGNWPFSRVPVYKDNPENLVGHVLRREAYTAITENTNDIPLKEIIRPIKFIPETLRLDHLLNRFLRERSHIMAVADEYGGLAGIVSLEDVLEELLGKEIVDEFDLTVDLQKKARDGSLAWHAMNLRKNGGI